MVNLHSSRVIVNEKIPNARSWQWAYEAAFPWICFNCHMDEWPTQSWLQGFAGHEFMLQGKHKGKKQKNYILNF